MSEPPASIVKWCEKMNIDLNTNDWKFYFKNIYNMSFKQKYRMFHYKILHRLLNVKEYLFKCKIEPSGTCTFCNETETIEHALCYCDFNGTFIQRVITWVDNLTSMSFEINFKDFLLGITNENNDSYIDLYNRIISLCKIFIWEQRDK